jgi:hypothetical protein
MDHGDTSKAIHSFQNPHPDHMPFPAAVNILSQNNPTNAFQVGNAKHTPYKFSVLISISHTFTRGTTTIIRVGSIASSLNKGNM